jgi:hypothetical protein
LTPCPVDGQSCRYKSEAVCATVEVAATDISSKELSPDRFIISIPVP